MSASVANRVVASVVLCGVLSAQEQPTFRTGTTLIEFTFVAIDERGNPVTDLTADEVAIAEDGRARKIAFYRYDGATDVREPKLLPPGEFSNRAEFTGSPPRNITALLLDTVNTRGRNEFPYEDQLTMRARIMQYLRSLEPGTRVAVYRLGADGVKVVHDFTESIESLRASISDGTLEVQLQKSIEIDEHAANERGREIRTLERLQKPAEDSDKISYKRDLERLAEMDRADVLQRTIGRTMAGLEALGDYLAAIPGRKNLVWVTSGTTMSMHSDDWLNTHEGLLRRTAQRLATKGVIVYPFDAKGLLGRRGFWSSMDLFANVTGGRTFKNADDPTAPIVEAGRDVRGSYAIGFYADEAPADRWHMLKVSVKRANVAVRHQQGYLSSGPASATPPAWTEELWRAAIASPLPSRGVQLNGRIRRVDDAEGGTIDLQLRIGSGDLQLRKIEDGMLADIDIVTAEKIPNGDFSFRVETATLKLPASTGTLPAAGYSRRLRLSPQTSSLRLIVRDRSTGRYGTLEIPVK